MPPAGDPYEGLKPGARVRIEGLKARPELNGTLATVHGFNDSGRCNVGLDDSEEVLALKLEALTVASGFRGIVIGARVRVGGLDEASRPELNGKVGTVGSFVSTDAGDLVNVHFDSANGKRGAGEKVAIKPGYLAVAEDAPCAGAGAGADAGSERTIRCECSGVMLKLTLSRKQMEKPFAEAILRPFLKAYSKKKGLKHAVGVDQVQKVTVDSDEQTALKVLQDIHIFSVDGVLRGLKGDIDVDIYLKGDKDLEVHAPPPPPRPPTPPPAPAKLAIDAEVEIFGLESEAGSKLNGLKGKVVKFHEDKGRYDVAIDGEDRTCSVKPLNLRVCDEEKGLRVTRDF